MTCVLRRHRRRINNRRLEAILPATPFAGSMDSRSLVAGNPNNFSFLSRSNGSIAQPPMTRLDNATSVVNTGLPRHVNPIDQNEGPFSDYYSTQRHLHTQERDIDMRAPSRATSTPSIYPPSIPEGDEDSLYEREIRLSIPPAPRLIPPTEYNHLERGATHVLTLDTQLDTLNNRHPPIAPGSPSTHLSSPWDGSTSSSSGHGTHGPPDTPLSENTTVVVYQGEEKVIGHPMLSSPPSAFLRRQLSKRAPLDNISQSPDARPMSTSSLSSNV